MKTVIIEYSTIAPNVLKKITTDLRFMISPQF